MDVYLEAGQKKVFASALFWPGWARSGQDETAALKTLFAYTPRYARAVQAVGLEFTSPASPADLVVVDRLPGGPATDFGVPELAPSYDASPVDEAELARLQAILQAGWQAFDAAARAAEGRELRKGPRGGGREVEGMIQHVLGAEAGYLSRIGGKAPKFTTEDPSTQQALIRQAILAGLASAVRDGIPPSPRGGKRWLPRYFVRRTTWHALDHAWELEDRIL